MKDARGYVTRNIWGEAKYKGYPLTPWFPPDVKPVRKGFYIAGSDQLSVMLYWNGDCWMSGWGKKLNTAIAWRGIDGEPK